MSISFASRILVAAFLAMLIPGNAQAQSATAGAGVMGVGQHAPFVSQPFPPALTSEQQRPRDEAMKRANRPGPPLPVGPERAAPTVSPTPGGTTPRAGQ